MAFLRAPNGAHLGPVSQFSAVQRAAPAAGHPELFSAHPGSDRFAHARELTVLWQPAVGDGDGNVMKWGCWYLRTSFVLSWLLMLQCQSFRIAVATLLASSCNLGGLSGWLCLTGLDWYGSKPIDGFSLFHKTDL